MTRLNSSATHNILPLEQAAESETDHSLPTSAKVKNAWSYTSFVH